MNQLRPDTLFFEPIFQEKVWGGTSLKSKLNKPIPAGKLIGESWELSGLDPFQSLVASGVHQGKTLQNLIDIDSFHLTGQHNSTFPLLFKFIDVTGKFSVQVHPSDVQAFKEGWGKTGKTECWYVVDTQKDAQLILGFKREVNKEILLDAIGTNTIGSLLNVVSVKPGEVYFIPAGTIHSALGNSLIYEIQQSSDKTLRFYDWDRLETSDHPRPLHIHEALRVVDMDLNPSYLINPVVFEHQKFIHSYRIACRYFAIEEYLFTHPSTVILQPRKSMRVITVISGTVVITSDDVATVITRGTTVLLPFVLTDVAITGEAAAHAVITFIPDLKEDIIIPLIARKIPHDKIAALGGNGKGNDLNAYLGEMSEYQQNDGLRTIRSHCSSRL